MLPWFVGIQEDHETLEVIEGGSWAELATAHRDLRPASRTPSGLANRYATIPYAFPAATQVASISALSDALVGRRRWTDPAVLTERAVLLGNDLDKTAALISKWQDRAVEAAKDAFAIVQATERSVFGTNSYFYRLENHITTTLPADDPSPDPLSIGADPTVAYTGKEGDQALEEDTSTDSTEETTSQHEVEDEPLEGTGEEEN